MDDNDMSVPQRLKKCEKALYRHEEINDIAEYGRQKGSGSQSTLFGAIENMSTLDYMDYVGMKTGKDPTHAQIEAYCNETYQMNKVYNDGKHLWPTISNPNPSFRSNSNYNSYNNTYPASNYNQYSNSSSYNKPSGRCACACYPYCMHTGFLR
jgi:hypothetical protein